MKQASHDQKGSHSHSSKSFETAARDVGHTLGEIASEFANAKSDLTKSGREYINKNPAKSLAIAAAAGMAAGCLLTLALRRKR